MTSSVSASSAKWRPVKTVEPADSSPYLPDTLQLVSTRARRVNNAEGKFEGVVLIELAQHLVDSVEEADVAARYGGDEFLVLLDEVSSAALPSAWPSVQTMATMSSH